MLQQEQVLESLLLELRVLGFPAPWQAQISGLRRQPWLARTFYFPPWESRRPSCLPLSARLGSRGLAQSQVWRQPGLRGRVSRRQRFFRSCRCYGCG